MVNLKGIFEKLINTRTTLFQDKKVLLDETYIPENLLHRETEAKKLASILAVALRGETPSNILIYGKSGAEKTAVAKVIADELVKTGKKMGREISVVYLDCQIFNTEYRVFAKLANQFGGRVPFTGWPMEKVYNTFKELADKKKQYILVILDQIDKVFFDRDHRKEIKHLLYLLTRINSEFKNTKLSLIGISPDLRFVKYLNLKVQSSLGREEIEFLPYNEEQLKDILKQRAESAFKEGVSDESTISLCAKLTAQDGDARKAIDLLKIAGEIAEIECSDKITDSHIKKAEEKIRRNKINGTILPMLIQKKLVLYSALLLEENRITTGELYQKYKELARALSLDILTIRRISDFIFELEMSDILSCKVISLGRYGRTKEIKLEMNPLEIKRVLEEDEGILNFPSFLF